MILEQRDHPSRKCGNARKIGFGAVAPIGNEPMALNALGSGWFIDRSAFAVQTIFRTAASEAVNGITLAWRQARLQTH